MVTLVHQMISVGYVIRRLRSAATAASASGHIGDAILVGPHLSNEGRAFLDSLLDLGLSVRAAAARISISTSAAQAHRSQWLRRTTLTTTTAPTIPVHGVQPGQAPPFPCETGLTMRFRRLPS
jgi:hypothetical protein